MWGAGGRRNNNTTSGDVPIVQGVAVDNNNNIKTSYQSADDTHGAYSSVSPEHHQPAIVAAVVDTSDLDALRQNPIKQFQDVIWAIAFILHLVAILAVIAMEMMSNNNGNIQNGDVPSTVFFMVGVTGLASIGMSCMALSFMMNHTEILVQTALIFSITCSLFVAVLGFLFMGSIMMGCLGLLSFAIGCCYAKIVWPRIPFAAANLNTALTAVKANMGLNVVSFGLTILAFVWTVIWVLGVGGALLQGDSSTSSVIVFLLFLSYYWVHQVLQNTMHVTTAGVVGTWWWVPAEASSFWSSALTDSLVRATTYSFGSICFGSFLVAVVQALRALERHSRDNDDLQLLSCIIQCILACIESIIELLNRWAYVYVGLYGFSYLEAGRNVLTLFQNRGWTAIISDDLSENVLFMMSVAIGLASGLVGLVLGFMDVDMFAGLGMEHAALPGFGIGFLAGFLFASIIMSVVGSAVNTVIVCYAEDPAAFQMNHPQLSTEMRQAWVQAWPGVSI